TTTSSEPGPEREPQTRRGRRCTARARRARVLHTAPALVRARRRCSNVSRDPAGATHEPHTVAPHRTPTADGRISLAPIRARPRWARRTGDPRDRLDPDRTLGLRRPPRGGRAADRG